MDSEALPLPTPDRVGLDQVQGSSPRGPDSRKHHPEPSIFPPHSRNSLPPLQHSTLLGNGQVLQRPIAPSRTASESWPSQDLDQGSQSGGKIDDFQADGILANHKSIARRFTSSYTHGT